MAIIGRRLLGGAAALTVAALLTACGDPWPPPAAGPGSASAPSRPAPSSASPTPTGLTDSQYLVSLAGIDRPVSAALARLAASGSQADLSAASAAASGAAEQVSALAPPEEASLDNSMLAGDLSSLADDLRNLGTDSGGATCAAANTAVGAGAAASMTGLATAVRQMAAAGRPTGLTVPKFPVQQKRSLPNGSYLRNTDRTGNGKLTIENGGSGDAVLTLTRSGKRSLAVYLRKGASYTVKNVRDGSYAVYFATGTDWDAKHKGFTTGCAYQKFDKGLTFTTKYTSSYVEYTTYTLTLYGIAGGTASTSDVPPAQFPSP